MTATRPSQTLTILKNALLALLAEKEINEVLLEAGPTLNASFLQQGFLDELVVYQAPHVLGPDSLGMFAGLTLTDMAQRPQFELHDVRRIGGDLRLSYAPVAED